MSSLHSLATGADLHIDKRFKEPVRVVSTINVSLISPGTIIDGVTLATGDRVLLTAQSTPSQNGIYVWTGASSTMSRASDAGGNADFPTGFMVYVTSGTGFANTIWVFTTATTVVIGSTSLAFTNIQATGPVGPAGATGATGQTGATGSTGATGATSPYVCMQDQKTSGTNGGAISSGSWVTRTLNTIIANDLSIASLAANQITLPAGTYQCSIVVPGFAVDNHQARLFNVSSNTALLYGPNSRGASTGSNFSYALVVGLFVLLSSQVVRVEQQVQTTNGTNGLGMAMSFGSTEVYTVVQLWLVGGPPPIGAQRTDYRRPILYPQQPWNTTAHLGLLGIANAPI